MDINSIHHYDTTLLYDNKHMQFKKTKSPDGSFDWFYAHRPHTKNGQDDGVIIAPFIHEATGDSVLFIETRRPPIYAEGKAETGIEFPAGLIGDERIGESVEDAINAELLEETGLKADKIKVNLTNVQSSGGIVSETTTLARADIYSPQSVAIPQTDNGVIIAQHKVPINEVNKWLLNQSKQGKSVSASVLAALYCAQAFGSNK